MGLIDDLGTGPVALDTPSFIYLIEEHPKYLPIVRPIFVAFDAGRLKGVTSVLTLMETLVLPYRLGNTLLARQYESFFTRSRGLKLEGITLTTCRITAQLRATYNIKTPDALQIATALIAECSTFVTNDRDLPTVPDIRIIQIKNYLQLH